MNVLVSSCQRQEQLTFSISEWAIGKKVTNTCHLTIGYLVPRSQEGGMWAVGWKMVSQRHVHMPVLRTCKYHPKWQKKKKVKTVFCSLPSASVGTGSSMLPTPQCGHQNPQMLEPLIQNALAGQSVLCILGFLTCPQMQNPLVQRGQPYRERCDWVKS